MPVNESDLLDLIEQTSSGIHDDNAGMQSYKSAYAAGITAVAPIYDWQLWFLQTENLPPFPLGGHDALVRDWPLWIDRWPLDDSSLVEFQLRSRYWLEWISPMCNDAWHAANQIRASEPEWADRIDDGAARWSWKVELLQKQFWLAGRARYWRRRASG